MPGLLSVAVVSKCDPEALHACLEHIHGIAGELCVVDTCGYEPIIPVAQEFQAKVSTFLWCDDATQAYNEVLRLCTGDWVLLLEPGERLTPKDLETLRKLAGSTMDLCHAFEIRHYTSSDDAPGFISAAPGDPMAHEFPGWTPTTEVRLFPNRPQIQFEGTPSCSPRGSLERMGIRVSESGLIIHQYPTGRNASAAPKAQPQAEANGSSGAVQAYMQALKKNPNDAAALRSLGQALRQSGQPADALEVLHRAVKIDPHNAEGWQTMSLAYFDRQEWGAAQDCLERAVVLDPSWLEGRRLLSMALERQGLLGDAADEARRAFESMPRSQDCLKMFIHLMLRLERREEAREVILDLVTRGVDDPNLHNAMAELYYYDKMFQESKHHFRMAGELGLAGAFNNLGVVHFSMGELVQARDAFDQCLQMEPGHAGALSNRDKVMRRMAETGG